MIHNDVLRSVRYMLDSSDARFVEIFKLSGLEVPTTDVIAFLKREDEAGYKPISDREMAHFLDGLIIYRRGKLEGREAPPIELPVTNNTVLKKLRVAFELQDEDLKSILNASGFPVTKTELSALFRKPNHAHFRPCGDQFLRNVLKGLTLRVRK